MTQHLRNPHQSERLANEMCPNKVIRITGNSIRSNEKDKKWLYIQCSANEKKKSMV